MRFSLEAVARFAGLRNYTYRDPGAHAPGFMLAPAPQASNELTTISPWGLRPRLYAGACFAGYILRLDGNARGLSFFISAAESAPAGIAALVPVGSGPELSHKSTGPRRSCPACGTYRHELNAPGSNLPIRHVLRPRRYASDRPLDHRAWQLPRHDLEVQLAKAEFVPTGCKAQQSAASRWQRPIPPPHERPQWRPAVCKSRSGGSSGLSPAMPLPLRSVFGSRASGFDSPAKSALRSERFERRDGILAATSGRAAQLPPALAEGRSATGPVESPRRLARPALLPLPRQQSSPR